MSPTKTDICRAAMVAAAMFGFAVKANADVKLRLPVDYSLENPVGRTITEFKRLVEERSKGEITVEIYPEGNLYKGADAVQAVLRGDSEMTAVVSPHWIGVSPKLSIFELPYAFPNREAIYSASADEDFLGKAFDEVHEKGATLIGIFVYDYALLANSAKPLIQPADFAGIKLRAIGKTNGRFLELLGATTVPVNITEVSLAIERGIIEGMSTAPDFWVDYKWSESVKYATDANFLIFYYPWMANTQWWDGLTDDERTIIKTSLAEVVKSQQADVLATREKSMEALRAQGIEIHDQTPEEAAAWKTATEAIWSDAEAAYGKDLLDSLRTAAGQK